MTNFIIPGMYEHHKLNFNLLQLFKNHPEYFQEDVNISAVYGNFQFCIWDGGRIFHQYRQTTKEEIEYIVHTYNEQFQVPIRLVFTNSQLTLNDYYNRFGNLVLKLCETGMNEIVVNDDNFLKWIQDKYPNYSFISSTTKCLNTPVKFFEELDKNQYKMICLDYNLNNNWDFLNSIPLEKRDKCEFLVNAICAPGCPQRKEHYKLNSLFHLSYGKKYSMENCGITQNTLSTEVCSNSNYITPEDIYTTYAQAGFNLFKLEGRTLSLIENVCNYIKYLIKPEYQLFVLNLLYPEQVLIKNKIFL